MVRTAGELHDARRLTSNSMVRDPRRRDSSLCRRDDSTFSPCLANSGGRRGSGGKVGEDLKLIFQFMSLLEMSFIV
jgi:hypothetical protein